MGDEFDLDLDGMTDNEMLQQLDGFLSAIIPCIEEDEARTTILDTHRLKQFVFAYNTMRSLTKHSDAVVTHKLYEPFKTMGSISVEAGTICIDDPVRFAAAVRFASNFEVYTLTKNKVRMTLTFHGLTRPFPEGDQA